MAAAAAAWKNKIMKMAPRSETKKLRRKAHQNANRGSACDYVTITPQKLTVSKSSSKWARIEFLIENLECENCASESSTKTERARSRKAGAQIGWKIMKLLGGKITRWRTVARSKAPIFCSVRCWLSLVAVATAD